MVGTLSFDYIEHIFARTDADLKVIVEDAKDWCHCYGLEIRTAEQKGESDVCQIAPFALFPSPFPKPLFDYAYDIQQSMSKLYFRVSFDTDFLLESLASVIKYDEFTRNMVDILRKLLEENALPEKVLLIQRSDYMCHSDGDNKFSLKQIEVNNIAASMGSLGERVSALHRRILRRLKYDVSRCPENNAIDTVCRGIYSAWVEYGNKDAVVLVVVEEQSQNAMDQRFVEFQIEEKYEHSLTSIRLTLVECHSRLSLSEKSELLIDGGKFTASVVYFRACYEPSSYPTPTEWKTRLLIERSKAIKCPWIGLQLANTKKIQQKLAEEGVLERYLKDDVEYAAKIRNTFAGLWGLDGEDVDNSEIFQEALKSPEKFVLKPQLEGGARNYYGKEIAEKLTEFGKDERAAHILMEKVSPLVIKNYLMRANTGAPKLRHAVGEFGVFGALLGERRSLKCISTFVGGHVLRTKLETVDEGGVAVGASVIDSPYLV